MEGKPGQTWVALPPHAKPLSLGSFSNRGPGANCPFWTPRSPWMWEMFCLNWDDGAWRDQSRSCWEVCFLHDPCKGFLYPSGECSQVAIYGSIAPLFTTHICAAENMLHCLNAYSRMHPPCCAGKRSAFLRQKSHRRSSELAFQRAVENRHCPALIYQWYPWS